MNTGERAADHGWFVTFEGPEGGGKTTQAQRLGALARAAGIPVLVTREPGGTSIGERIRAVLLDPAPSTIAATARTDALLFSAARAQLVVELIEPALARGELVICGRFADSTLAYQGYGSGLPLDELVALARFATGGRVPDLTIVLDLPVEVGLGRKDGADLTRFESTFDVDFHRRVRDGFLTLAAAEPERFVVIDATRAADQVSAEVVSALDRLPDLARLLGRGPSDPPDVGADAPPPSVGSEPDGHRQRMYR